MSLDDSKTVSLAFTEVVFRGFRVETYASITGPTVVLDGEQTVLTVTPGDRSFSTTEGPFIERPLKGINRSLFYFVTLMANKTTELDKENVLSILLIRKSFLYTRPLSGYVFRSVGIDTP